MTTPPCAACGAPYMHNSVTMEFRPAGGPPAGRSEHWMCGRALHYENGVPSGERHCPTMLISPEYRAQCRALADAQPDWGSSSAPLLDILPDLRAHAQASRAILDYGCGTGEFVRAVERLFHAHEERPIVKGYDPRNEAAWPHPPETMRGLFDLVVISDVLEHVERTRVAAVLADIAGFLSPDGLAFFAVSTVEAQHVLPATVDLPERNAHITVEPLSWWMMQMSEAGLRSRGEIVAHSGGFFGWWGRK